MEKKLLNALNNVSEAIMLLSDILSDKNEQTKASTSKALQTSDIGEKLKSLDLGVKNIQKDTKEILKNQKTIMNMSSKDDKSDRIETLGDPKKKQSIKDGASMLIMIASGVLAIGLAFKIVGGVDFASVIALAIALPLVAIAFEKIAQMKGLRPKDMLNIVFITVAISTAIVASSYILSAVQPVGLFQLFTAVFIAGMFGAVSFGIGKLITGITKSGLTMFDMAKISVFLPIVMIAVSAAIVGSSYLLSNVRPVGLFQLFTAVFIAAAFGVISYGLGKLLQGMKNIGSPKDAATIALILPIVLVGVAAAIAGSSYFLSQIQPIGLFQFFTAAMIAIVFIPISFALPYISKALKDIDVKRIILLPVVMVAISAAIMASSYLLAETKLISFGLLFNIVAQSITLATIAVALGFAFKVLDKIPMSAFIKGSLALITIAATIMVSSLILSKGNYDKFPSFEWILSVGISMVGFGLATVALGVIAMSGIGALAIIAGAGMMLVVASTIVATAAILATGDYSKFPSYAWSLSVGLSLVAFGTGMMLLGTFVVGTLGLGGLAMVAGAAAVGVVAQSIVDASIILQNGKFRGGPTVAWSRGIAIALGAFTPIYGMMMKNSIFELFGGGGVGPSDFAEAIRVVSGGILDAANIFAGAKTSFVGGPSKEWSEGVGGAISAFAPVYLALSKNSGFFSSGDDVIKTMKNGIVSIADSIVEVSKRLAGGKWSTRIDPTFIQNISDVIKKYIGIVDYLTGKKVDDFDILEDFADGLVNIANAYDEFAKSIDKLNGSLSGIDMEKIGALKTLTGGIILMSLMDADQFSNMMDELEDKADIFVETINKLEGDQPGRKSDRTAPKVNPIGTEIKAGAKAKDDKMDKVLAYLDQMNQNLGSIASDARSIQDNLIESQTGEAGSLSRNFR